MKVTTVVLGLVLALQLGLVARSARAETPSNDPAVNDLRERFKRARAPKAEDLAYGRSWTCEYRSALAGSHEHDVFGNYFNFRATSVSAVVENRMSSQAPYFHFKKKSLIGNYTDGKKIFASDRVRVGDQGELISEYTLPECSGVACLFFGWAQDRAVDNYWAAILGYRECRVDE